MVVVSARTNKDIIIFFSSPSGFSQLTLTANHTAGLCCMTANRDQASELRGRGTVTGKED
jgi:hypothetical protein